jgi:hypothetical protein
MLYLSGIILIVYLLVLAIISFRNRRNFDTAHSIIFYVINFALISEILLRLCAWYFRNNILLYNLFNLIEFLFFFYFYFKFIGRNLSKYTYLLILMITLIFYFSEFISRGVFSLLCYSFIYKNAVLILLSILAFRKVINSPKSELITDYSIFWINISVLIYYSTTFFIFGLRKYTASLYSLSNAVVYVHILFIFVFYGLLSVGLWKVKK